MFRSYNVLKNRTTDTDSEYSISRREIGLLIAVIFIFWTLFGRYFNTTILLVATFLIYFCLQTFAILKRRFYREAYLIALYCTVRNTY